MAVLRSIRNMARKSQPKVVYEHSILAGLAEIAQAAFPYETGGFLLMRPEHLGTGQWCVGAYYCVSSVQPSRASYTFHNEHYFAAQKYGSGQGLVLCGFFHSHPWTRPPLSMTLQSHADAELQRSYDFPLSLVIGVSPQGWSAETWRNHCPAPLLQRIGAAGKEYSLLHWLRRKPVASGIWERHLLWKPSDSAAVL